MFVNKLHQKADETLKSGEIQDAIKLYTEVLAEFPNDTNVLSDRGVAFLHSNNQVDCYKDLDLAIALQPNYAYRYACRAFAKNHFGDINGAVRDYEKAIDLDPNDSVAHNNLGLLLEKKGYAEEANKRFDQADKLSKMEDELFDVIDELEQPKNEQQPDSKEESLTTKIDPKTKDEDWEKATKEFKKVFTSKEQFKEFVNFIKNGFKIK